MKWFFTAGTTKTRSASAGRRRQSERKFQIESLEVRRVMAANFLHVGQPVVLEPSAPAPAAYVAQAFPAAAAATAATASTKIDFDVTVDAGAVVPTQAKDLNLLHFFGGEKLTVPTVVRNYGPGVANGNVTVSVYLSTTRDLMTSPVLLGQRTLGVNLGNDARQLIELNTTIPTTLVSGTKYFIVAKITTPLAQSTINDIRPSDRQFEFVGTPKNLAPFQPDANGQIQYFNLIRDTLNGDFVARRQNPDVKVNDAKSFLGHWQGDYKSPTMVGNVPTISVGVNLNTLSPAMTRLVATYVRGYYSKTYRETLPSDDNAVIAMLKSQAATRTSKQAIDDPMDQAIFNAAYAERQQAAINALGQTTFSKLNPMARIAVMDQVYATGTVVPETVAPLRVGDYVMAGFKLLDSPRARDASTRARVEAQYQELLYTTRMTLGGTPRSLLQ